MRQIGTPRTNEGQGVAVDTSGNPYLLYNTSVSVSSPGVDLFVAKYDPSGSPQWTRQFGTSENDTGRGMASDTLGNVLVTGTTQGSLGGPFLGEVDGFLIKIAGNGTTQWARQVGTTNVDFAFGVSADHNGNALVVGTTDGVIGSASFGGSDAFVAKYDVNGGLLWSRQFGSSNGDTAFDVASDALGNVYVVGETAGNIAGSTGGLDIFLAKFASNGAPLWTRQFGTSSSDSGVGIEIDADGFVYVAGEARGVIPGSSDPFLGEIDAFLAKYSPAGDRIWTRQWGSSKTDAANGVAIDAAGGVFVSGYTFGQIGSASLGTTDGFVTNFDRDGHLQWSTQFGTASRDYGLDVALGPLQRAYVPGTTEGSFGATNAGGSDAFLVKLVVPEPSSVALGVLAVLVPALFCRRRSVCISTSLFCESASAVR